MIIIFLFLTPEFLELDMDSGPLLNHLELADLYRHETQTYVRACLGLTGSPQLESFKSSDATIQAFEIIGNAIRQVYNYGLTNSCSSEQLFAMTAID